MKKIIPAIIWLIASYSVCLAQETGTVTDVDGNIYKTVKIGNQVWMAENLRVTHYRNGDEIKYAEKNEGWNFMGGSKVPLMCDLENSKTNAKKFGKLYNCYAVYDRRDIAPEGWHVATVEDWDTLIFYISGDKSLAAAWQFDQSKEKWPAVAGVGDKLKAAGKHKWKTYKEELTDLYGFSALPGGSRDGMGPFRDDPGTVAWWWAGNEQYLDWKYKEKITVSKNNYIYVEKHKLVTKSVSYIIIDSSDDIVKLAKLPWSGLSVRCVKNR